jgi:phage terminase large subunit-like protein
MANFSACTTWGTFYASEKDRENGVYSVMLCDAWQKRVDFTDLRDQAIAMWKRWHPDDLIIEEKQSGAPLRSVLYEHGISAIPYVPSRGKKSMPNDKFSRLNSISDVFRAGMVYAPLDEAWAAEVRESCARAGFGGDDDLADTTTMAMMRFREGRLIRLPNEVEAERDRQKMVRQKGPPQPSVRYW